MNPKSIAQLSLLVCLAATSPGRAAGPAAAEPHLVTREGTAMGTEVRVSVFTADQAGAEKAMSDAFAEVSRIERLMTTWRDDSEVSRINAAAGKSAVPVSPETLEVIDAAMRSSKLSDGAFDITFYALKGLWKFDEDLEKRIPRDADIKKRLPLVDWRKVTVDHAQHTVKLEREGMAINLGGIAKGYAVDRAAAVLKRAGFTDAIVQAGGDLLCAGSKGGKPWTAGIRDPRGDRADVFAVLQLSDHAFSTAGDYERFFLLGGKRYHHILDPKTGRPAMRSRSVTIYAKTALEADALDDAVFILGWKRGLELVEKLDDVGAVVVDEAGGVHISSRLKDRLQLVHAPTNAL